MHRTLCVAVLVLLVLGLGSTVPTARSEDPPAEDALRLRVGALEEEVADLKREVAELRALVEPVQDLLPVLERIRPNLLAARREANAMAAIATLRNIVVAQAHAQAVGFLDRDGDGRGEYAGLAELAGTATERMGGRARDLLPPVLGTLGAHGEARRSGYAFRVFLPDADGRGVGEPSTGFRPSDPVDADVAETAWCAYAWPLDEGPGAATFFTNQDGVILKVEDARYVGPGNGPDAAAAFTTPAITGPAAVDAEGRDGNRWRRLDG